ncbi:stalk domain-containing protein [Paenibacillus polymyxa]|uniref:stalk domain-containing protein n=1 Tax=Paenibacillus polymyxa TaxID=1406 RepID=UPI0025B6B95E|nr:stalk domain-containing protein [Paenibacillus polymyxa]MDN4084853.1 stalk domain-containing protein [Paenibacillus polymyxa]MDN4108367.1 stalk domain-containing protein [Paenibacillus polymyxa]
MTKRIPTFLAGAIFGVAVAVSGVAGASTYLKATLTPTKIIVDGEQAKLSDSPINVNGKAYLPLRDTASAMGYNVASASGAKIELVKSNGATPAPSSTPSATTTTKSESPTTAVKSGGKTFNVDQYTKGDKLDSEKIAAAIASGELTINSQDANGDSILHWVIRKNDYNTWLLIKKNALNVNIVNNKKQSPLHEAALQNSNFYIGELESLHANPKLMDIEGKKPIEYIRLNSSNYISLEVYMMKTD